MSKIKDLDEIKQYTEDFTEHTKVLSKLPLTQTPSLEVREREVQGLVDQHVEMTGEYPQPYALTKLADYLLADHLKDPDRDKVANNEYPVLSQYQAFRRSKSQVAMESDTMDFLESKINKKMDSLATNRVKKAEY